MSDNIFPFKIAIDEAKLVDLRERLAATHWPAQLPGAAWAKGAPTSYLRELAEYWRTSYDWREHEALLNSYPQFTTDVDGVTLHFLHVRSPEPDALPLVLAHGWPGSIIEFLDVIGPLTDPRNHGGDPADAFHLVIPCLPGFGFSSAPTEPGWDSRRMAGAIAEVMTRLGYDRYGAQGGDFGAFVAPDLARVAPERVVGVHVNAASAGFIPFGGVDEATLAGFTEAERVRYERMQGFMSTGNAYFQIQATRPQTISYALTDSPVGLLAWIVEKFQEWTFGDGLPETAVDRDRMLTNIMLYWLTGSAGTAANLYYESVNSHNWPTPSGVPTGVAVFAEDIAIRQYGDQVNTITHWAEYDRGGHFAAMEVPDLLAEDVRTFFRTVR
ncbi:epoxide hydrolase family protein [Longispora sp. NPDC051575]|uniref:epoxide hydrolase family protein n=1 Tax=Longispora sp. NPDC051575 TaxID=3154943 RepID=UPI00342EE935